MDNLHNDERISAYLDGELSADEQARFEERLAESAELRQLVEELRALRGSLDLLPRHRLESDFADHVLRRAEREMLTAGDGSSGSGPTEGHAVRGVADDSRNWKRRALRPLIYAAVAIAAAVLIMVFNPPRNKDVAQIADNAKPARLPEGAVVFSKESGGGTAPGAAGGASRSSSDARKELESLAERKDSNAAHGGRANFSDEDLRRSGGVAEQARHGGLPADSSSGSLKNDVEASKAGNLAQSLGKSELGQANGQLSAEEDAIKAKTPAGALPNQAARDGGGQGTGLRSKIGAGGVEKTPLSGRGLHFAETPAAAPGPDGPAATAKGRATGDQSAGLAANERDSAKEVLRRRAVAPAGIVVANCIASPEAAEHVFFGLLAKNRIATDALSDGAPTTYSATFDRFAKKSEAPADKDDLLRTGDKLAEAKRSLGEIAKAKDQSRDVAVFYVEGTGEQIQDLVNDLRAEPEVFRSLSVAPAPTQAVASFAYQGTGGYAGESRPVELEIGGAWAGNKPAAHDAEPRESLREREAFGATAKGQAPPSMSAKAPAGNELSDQLTSDQKSVAGLGARLSRTDKAMKDQVKQTEPAGAAIADEASAVAGKPMKPAEIGAPNASAEFWSPAPQRSIGEKSPPVSGLAPETPVSSKTFPSVPATPNADGSSPSQLSGAPAAPAAIADSANRTMTRAEADKKVTEWRDKQVPTPSEPAEARQERSPPLSYAVRLDSWILESPPVQLEPRKASEPKADDAPANTPAPPADAGSVAGGAGPSPRDRAALKKDEAKSLATKLSLPSIEERGDRRFLRSDSKSTLKDADDSLHVVAPPRMQAIFVFRLAPAPAAAAAAAPPAQPPAARPPAAGDSAPAAIEK